MALIPFSDTIPELEEPPFCDWMFVNAKFSNYSLGQQELILNLVFAHLAKCFGGYHVYWHDDTERLWLTTGYRDLLCDLTVKNIFGGVTYVKKGLSGYVDRPPRTPIQFLEVCKKSSNAYYQALTSANPANVQLDYAADEEKARRAMSDMRKILSESRANRFSEDTLGD